MAAGLRVPPATHNRRHVVRLAVGAGATIAGPLSGSPVFADTQAELAGPSAASEANEIKRAEFIKKQKTYKKNWRKELSNFEFASNDKESVEAMEALYKVRRGAVSIERVFVQGCGGCG